MRQIIKNFAALSGLFRLSSWLNRNLLTILMYHGISQPSDNVGLINFEGKHKNVDEFEKELKLLVKYCNPISLESAILNTRLPANPVVLTFDDGYRNNYTYAYPLLKKYHVPATIFLTTGFIDRTHYLWTDQLEYIIDHAPFQNIDFHWEAGCLKLEMASRHDKMRTIGSIKRYLKTLSETNKLNFLNQLQSFLEIEYDWDKIPSLLLPLSWDEIREMQQSGLVSFGSHTVTHPILANCSAEQQQKELAFSQQRLNVELGKTCDLFAYPNGTIADYNEKTIALLKELGYLGAVTTTIGYIDEQNRDNFQLSRFGTGGNLVELGTIVTGLSRLVGTI